MRPTSSPPSGRDDPTVNPSTPTRRPGSRRLGDGETSRRRWMTEPRSAVWLVMAGIILIGGGRRLLRSWRASRAVERLSDPALTVADIEAAAEFGRSGAWELLRIFSTVEPGPIRDATGRALARLWKEDELVAEEEKALVRRGFTVSWRARRRYPRDLDIPISIAVRYDVPFLDDDPALVQAGDLQWSHRIMGARRAALEEFSEWRPGPVIASFPIIPGDFPTIGPHRLVLQVKVRTAPTLSDSWEIDLPHVPFPIEFDPALKLDAILTLSDAVRDEAMTTAIRLEPPDLDDTSATGRNLAIGEEWVIRRPPQLAVETPLPSDLAHRISVELEGHPERIPAGSLIVSGQGTAGATSSTQRFPIGPMAEGVEGAIERPGPRRIRLHLSADPQLGWSDPDVRSLWPGEHATNWVEIEIIRR